MVVDQPACPMLYLQNFLMSEGKTMKHLSTLIVALLLLCSMGLSQTPFNKSAETEAFQLLQTGPAKAWCPVCGMNLKMFYKTNHVNSGAGDAAHQYCSIRCLAADMENVSSDPNHMLVVDVHSEKMIPVKKAHYVVGSTVPGTMSRSSKLAFKSKRQANKFLKEYQGEKIVGFAEALNLAKSQMIDDNSMLMKKRESMVYPKAKLLYLKTGLNMLDIPRYKTIPELKTYLKDLPQNQGLNEQQLQMLTLYIMGVVYSDPTGMNADMGNIETPKDAKCPVCGMFVHKYPKWAASLTITSGNEHQQLYFDGVKDLMKFYLEPSKWSSLANPVIRDIKVTDYYSQGAINAKAAIFVIGSDVLGPMGKELIPFVSKAEAATFMMDHTGQKMLLFDDIDANIVAALDK
jgi:nitrous oxide reductase accessory protein NosL